MMTEQNDALQHNHAEATHGHTEPTDYAPRDFNRTDLARMLADEPADPGEKWLTQ